MRGAPVQRFPGPAIHQVRYPIELLLAVHGQIRTLGQELANQSIGVLKIVKVWVKALLKLKWRPQTGWEIMDATVYGPPY